MNQEGATELIFLATPSAHNFLVGTSLQRGAGGAQNQAMERHESANKALHLTAIPLRSIATGELCVRLY